MRPDKHTPGNIGDIVTDESTGKKYKLVSIYFMDVDGDLNDEKTFEWDELPDEGGSGGSGDNAGPCSWNDLTDKPFGEEVALEVIVPETSDTYIDEHVTTHGDIPDNWINGGEIFVVTVDEVKYPCVAYECTDYYGSVYIGIGDSRLELFLDENANEIPNINHPEDVPFFVRYSCEDLDGTGLTWIHGFAFFYPDSETHTIEIAKPTDEMIIKPLDEKYIPESIARRSDTTSWNDLTDKPFGEEPKLAVIVPETNQQYYTEGELNFGFSEDKIMVGGTYVVTVDGVSYSCVAYTCSTIWDDMYICLGDTRLIKYPEGYETSHPEDVPFYIEYYCEDVGDGVSWTHQYNFSYADEEPHTIKIEKETGKMAIKPLDEKFIPDSVARKSDIAAIVDEYIATALGGDY